MTTVCIIGAGELGGAVAHALARGGRVGRLLLIDAAGSVASGKALDIQQSGAIEGCHALLSGTDDFTRVTACNVCVIADRAGSPAGNAEWHGNAEWQGDEGLAMTIRLAPFLADAPVVFAGPAQSELLRLLVREGGLRRERVVGSAPEAFVSAVTAIVAMEARCSPDEVSLAVLGSPPSGFVIPWSEASIAGYAVETSVVTGAADAPRGARRESLASRPLRTGPCRSAGH